MVTIAVTNQKGGVGKTTITFNLAQILAIRKYVRVLAIDNDPQGNLTSSFIDPKASTTGSTQDAYEGNKIIPSPITKNLDLLGSNINLAKVSEQDFQVIFRLKESIEKLQRKITDKPYDYILIDCLPSFGHLHLAALTAADFILVPVKPAPYALAGLKDLFDTVARVKKFMNSSLRVLGIVINQVDGRRLVLEREMEAALRETYGSLVFRQRISKRCKLEESPAFKKSIIDYHPADPGGREFSAVANEIQKRLRSKENSPFRGDKR